MTTLFLYHCSITTGANKEATTEKLWETIVLADALTMRAHTIHPADDSTEIWIQGVARKEIRRLTVAG